MGDFERRVVSTVVDGQTTVVRREPTLPLARVQVGVREVFGALVLDEAASEGPVVVSVAGSVPTWLDDGDVRAAGWQPTEEVPDGLTDPLWEVELHLWVFTDRGHPRCWACSLWLPYIPRPMERLTVTAGDGSDRSSVCACCLS